MSRRRRAVLRQVAKSTTGVSTVLLAAGLIGLYIPWPPAAGIVDAKTMPWLFFGAAAVFYVVSVIAGVTAEEGRD